MELRGEVQIRIKLNNKEIIFFEALSSSLCLLGCHEKFLDFQERKRSSSTTFGFNCVLCWFRRFHFARFSSGRRWRRRLKVGKLSLKLLGHYIELWIKCDTINLCVFFFETYTNRFSPKSQSSLVEKFLSQEREKKNRWNYENFCVPILNFVVFIHYYNDDT